MSPADLLAAAQARFGPSLADRVAPGGDSDAKTLELTKIARSVIARVQVAAEQVDSWPLPGTWPPGSVSPLDGTTDISGQPYSDIWPDDLMERAIELLEWRTYAGLEVVPPAKVAMAKAIEAYFVGVSAGTIGLGVTGSMEPSSPTPIASRARDGTSLTMDGATDRRNVLDTFIGPGWDFYI